MAIVTGHSPFGRVPGTHFITGSTAVEAFFLISGFFITMVLCENPAYRKRSAFYSSRYLRLWPMYIVCAVPTLMLSSYNQYSFGSEASSYFATFRQLDIVGKAFVLFSNLTIFLQDWTVFLQADWQTGMLSFTPNLHAGPEPIMTRLIWDAPAWSLGIELVFYLIAPFVVRSPARVMALIAASIAVRIAVGFVMPVTDNWDYRFMPSELVMFGLGSIGYHWHRRVRHWRNPIWRPVTFVLGAAGLSFLIVAFTFHSYEKGLFQPLQALLLTSPLLLLILSIFIGPIFVITKSSAVDRWLGDMSYPMYLAHVGIFSAMTALGFQTSNSTLAIYVASTILTAAALLWLVDGPVNQFRRSLQARRPLEAAAVA
jgi:peptidoglycan/LPS O-acetylase OafA/YrhL